MKILSVTKVARNFRQVIDSVENKQEEIVLVRNRRQVARLVPQTPPQNALEVFGDLYRTLDEKTDEALSFAISAGQKGRRGKVSELRNPWAVDRYRHLYRGGARQAGRRRHSCADAPGTGLFFAGQHRRNSIRAGDAQKRAR